jgi:hypothetical protein
VCGKWRSSSRVYSDVTHIDNKKRVEKRRGGGELEKVASAAIVQLLFVDKNALCKQQFSILFKPMYKYGT